LNKCNSQNIKLPAHVTNLSLCTARELRTGKTSNDRGYDHSRVACVALHVLPQ